MPISSISIRARAPTGERMRSGHMIAWAAPPCSFWVGAWTQRATSPIGSARRASAAIGATTATSSGCAARTCSARLYIPGLGNGEDTERIFGGPRDMLSSLAERSQAAKVHIQELQNIETWLVLTNVIGVVTAIGIACATFLCQRLFWPFDAPDVAPLSARGGGGAGGVVGLQRDPSSAREYRYSAVPT
mmetsp:Transcript_66269/g.214220  ORF Transcript_66269/g.214220 Transcript_66269/m.214220 type:complete len:189 (-) Transcript_66269:14-580(-)